MRNNAVPNILPKLNNTLSSNTWLIKIENNFELKFVFEI